jgi:hypothetical protein
MTNHISFLNQIFYKHKKFDKENISELEQWMFTDLFFDNVETPKYGKVVRIAGESTVSSIPTKDIIRVVDQQPLSTDNPCLTLGGESVDLPVVLDIKPLYKIQTKIKGRPNNRMFLCNDTMFWSLYIAKYGESEYMQIGNKYKNVEIEEKLKMVQYIAKHSNLIKQKAIENGKKISNTRLQETQSEFMVNKQTSYYAFWIMCMFYGFNAVIIKPHTYMQFITDPTIPILVFHEDSGKRVTYDERDYTQEKLNAILDTKIYIDHTADKPLRGISAYTITDLEECADKLGITERILAQYDKPKKNDWYVEIYTTIS